MTMAPSRVVISDWEATSPLGIGKDEFIEHLAQPPTSPSDPYGSGHVPNFEVRDFLGKKGTRSMDRVTGLAVATVGQLLHDRDGRRLPGIADDTGLVLGTTTGSAESMLGFTTESLTQKKPYFVDPTRFPNTVMNCAAGQSAIWHQLKGPNTTVAAGRCSGIATLQYALRLARFNRARQIVCGAVEEMSPTRSRLSERHRVGPPHHSLAEGCAVTLLESEAEARSAGRQPWAEVVSVSMGVARDADDVARVLGDRIQRLRQSTDEPLWAVARSDAPGPYAAAESEALNTHVPEAEQLTVGDWIGDTGAASGGFQLAALLARSASQPSDQPRLALMTGVDVDGCVGGALLRLYR
ncbi:beta-ketoacyl synthase N-terminal-like domain-containing protein [Haloglycomyces albus]|uniref:beta-ketoacyl synthase N-terminal-like domain-containing protein n=1 Tax=Haloglycomyces albus TaxID=526067 RepID=UPI00046D4C69|nr:beta-ketoacyl synthase N-terminal-like domain-containing protein [Haloglycomyces albus]